MKVQKKQRNTRINQRECMVFVLCVGDIVILLLILIMFSTLSCYIFAIAITIRRLDVRMDVTKSLFVSKMKCRAGQ